MAQVKFICVELKHLYNLTILTKAYISILEKRLVIVSSIKSNILIDF